VLTAARVRRRANSHLLTRAPDSSSPVRGRVAAGMAAGLAAGAVAWLARGASADDLDLYRVVEASLLGAGLAAGGAVLVPALLDGPEGPGGALLAGPPAALMAAAVSGRLLWSPHRTRYRWPGTCSQARSQSVSMVPAAALAALVPLPLMRTGIVTALTRVRE